MKIEDIKRAEIVGYCGGTSGYCTIEIKLDGKLYDLISNKGTIEVKDFVTREIQPIELSKEG